METDIIAPLLGILVHASLVGYFGRLVYLSLRSKLWPSAEGVITKATIRISKATRQGCDVGYYHYTPVVQYEYLVDDKTLTGTRVYFGQAWPKTSQHAERTIALYDVGKPVTVRHHPAKPHVCTIETRCNRWAAIPVAFGLIVSVLIVIEGLTG